MLFGMEKKILGKRILSVVLFLVGFSPLFSQVVVDGNTAGFLRDFDDKKIKPARIDTSYWSVPKELRFDLAMHSVSDNWYQTDRRSNVVLNMKALINANYIREYTRWNNAIEVNLGFIWEDAGKLSDGARNLNVSQNKLRLETQYGVKLVRRFDFVTNAKLETQILPSYASNTAKESNKTFMAPGTMNVGVGASYNYSSNRLPKLSVSLFPVNNNTTFVLNQRLADAGTSGVDPAVKDDQGNIVRHGKKAKVVWGLRTEFEIKYFLLANKKCYVQDRFSMFVDYIENFGAGQIDNKTSFSFDIAKNISLSYDLTLRYYDNEKTTRYRWVTNDAGERIKQKEEHGATIQMLNDMAISLKFNF